MLQVAEAAARAAGRRLIELQGRVGVREKGRADLVTEADLASQELIAEILLDAYPDHTILAEEAGVRADPTRPWRWIVDPLDGTTNYAHNVPMWTVSIGLESRGELVLGVVFHPLMDDLFAAARGLGAWRNGAPMRVSTVPRLAGALLSTGFPTDFEPDADRQMRWFRTFSALTHSVRRTGSSAWNLALVAAGGFDGCYATAMNPWDAAAGVVLVREAGGVVTGLDGSTYDVYQGGIVASNGRVHQELVQTLDEADLADRAGRADWGTAEG
jgi:myo-inositol-1(or 4)-monophosphatase